LSSGSGTRGGTPGAALCGVGGTRFDRLTLLEPARNSGWLLPVVSEELKKREALRVQWRTKHARFRAKADVPGSPA
jgi:hypothetical protein